MPLNYRRSGVTYQINLYDSETPGWDDSLKIRSSGATKYAEISTNLSHPSASHIHKPLLILLYFIGKNTPNLLSCLK